MAPLRVPPHQGRRQVARRPERCRRKPVRWRRPRRRRHARRMVGARPHAQEVRRVGQVRQVPVQPRALGLAVDDRVRLLMR